MLKIMGCIYSTMSLRLHTTCIMAFALINIFEEYEDSQPWEQKYMYAHYPKHIINVA